MGIHIPKGGLTIPGKGSGRTAHVDIVFGLIAEKPGLLRTKYREAAAEEGVKKSSFYQCVRYLKAKGRIVEQRGSGGIRLYPRGSEEFADPDYIGQTVSRVLQEGATPGLRDTLLNDLLLTSQRRTILIDGNVVELLVLALRTPNEAWSQTAFRFLERLVERNGRAREAASGAFDHSAELRRLWEGIGEELAGTLRRDPRQGSWALDVLGGFLGVRDERRWLADLALQTALHPALDPSAFQAIWPAAVRALRAAVGEDRIEALRVKQQLEAFMRREGDDRTASARRLWDELRDRFVALSV